MTLPITPGAYRPGNMATEAKVAQWRLKRPRLATESCDGCLTCWMLCPDSAISPGDVSITFDLSLCKGCGICAHECPADAIRMEEEPDGR